MNYWRKPFDADKIKVPQGIIHIIEDHCKGCGFCVEYCPVDILKMSDGYNVKGYHTPVIVSENACVQCQLCEIICPEFAIFVTLKNSHPKSETAPDLRKEVEIVES